MLNYYNFIIIPIFLLSFIILSRAGSSEDILLANKLNTLNFSLSLRHRFLRRSFLAFSASNDFFFRFLNSVMTRIATRVFDQASILSIFSISSNNSWMLSSTADEKQVLESYCLLVLSSMALSASLCRYWLNTLTTSRLHSQPESSSSPQAWENWFHGKLLLTWFLFNSPQDCTLWPPLCWSKIDYWLSLMIFF